MTNPTESLPNEPAPVKVWPAGRIAAGVSTVLWLLMVLIGPYAIEGIRDQHVPDYPNEGQLRLYVLVPLIGLAGSGAIFAFAKRLPDWARRIGTGISFFALLLVFMTFGGGV